MGRGPHDLLIVVPDAAAVPGVARAIARAWDASLGVVRRLGDLPRSGPGPGDEERRLVRRLTRSPVAVIDGLFSTATWRALDGAFAVLHGRRVAGRPTAVTTHLGLDRIRREHPDFAEVLERYELLELPAGSLAWEAW